MGSLDKFRAEQILQRGKLRKPTFDEELSSGSSDTPVSISGAELGKILKIHFKNDRQSAEAIGDALGGFDGGVLISLPAVSPFEFQLSEEKLRELAGENQGKGQRSSSGRTNSRKAR